MDQSEQNENEHLCDFDETNENLDATDSEFRFCDFEIKSEEEDQGNRAESMHGTDEIEVSQIHMRL